MFNFFKRKKKKDDKWIWVEGYKATDYYMRGYGDFQYELGKVYTLPDGEEPVLCEKGFHFCRFPWDISKYYRLGRVFKVRALVKESEWELSDEISVSKFAAKSIELLEEVPIYETRCVYFKGLYFCESDEDYLDCIKWCSDKNTLTSWCLNRYYILMEQAGISKNRAEVLIESGFCNYNQCFQLAKYAHFLKEMGVSRRDIFDKLVNEVIESIKNPLK